MCAGSIRVSPKSLLISPVPRSADLQRKASRARWGTASFPERFWSKVDKSGDCWIWKGARHRRTGYGCARGPDGSQTQAHRVAFLLTKGPIPTGALVRHTCDVRLCVKPDHLLSGTHSENMRDRDERDRTPRGSALNHPPQKGERNHAAKLTNEIVRAVRAMRSAGIPCREIDRRLGLTYGHSWLITRRKIWNHID